MSHTNEAQTDTQSLAPDGEKRVAAASQSLLLLGVLYVAVPVLFYVLGVESFRLGLPVIVYEMLRTDPPPFLENLPLVVVGVVLALLGLGVRRRSLTALLLAIAVFGAATLLNLYAAGQPGALSGGFLTAVWVVVFWIPIFRALPVLFDLKFPDGPPN